MKHFIKPLHATLSIKKVEVFLFFLKNSIMPIPVWATCPICMGKMIDATATFCGHSFCYGCIRPWLAASTKCPICRSDYGHWRTVPQYALRAAIDELVNDAVSDGTVDTGDVTEAKLCYNQDLQQWVTNLNPNAHRIVLGATGITYVREANQIDDVIEISSAASTEF